MDSRFWLMVVGMGAVLYLTRIGGLLLVNRIPPSPLLQRVLDQLPGVTLVALVAPAVVDEGAIGLLAALLVWMIVARTGNITLSMIAGVACIALFG